MPTPAGTLALEGLGIPISTVRDVPRQIWRVARFVPATAVADYPVLDMFGYGPKRSAVARRSVDLFKLAMLDACAVAIVEGEDAGQIGILDALGWMSLCGVGPANRADPQTIRYEHADTVGSELNAMAKLVARNLTHAPLVWDAVSPRMLLPESYPDPQIPTSVTDLRRILEDLTTDIYDVPSWRDRERSMSIRRAREAMEAMTGASVRAGALSSRFVVTQPITYTTGTNLASSWVYDTTSSTGTNLYIRAT